MNSVTRQYRTVDELRAVNAKIDAQLMEAIAEIDPDEIRRIPLDGEWPIDCILGHIAEFPAYFARQLREWIDHDRLVVGRVAEYCADRNDAIARAPTLSLDELRKKIEASFAALASVLDALLDEHLVAATENVKYGQEPLRSYLDRYVVDHKLSHLRQIEGTLRAVRDERLRGEAGAS